MLARCIKPDVATIIAFARPLYLNTLDTVANIESLVSFYVQEHNSKPHSSFGGPSSDELYDGTADQVLVELIEAKKKARQKRLAANRSRSCEACLLMEPNETDGIGTRAA